MGEVAGRMGIMRGKSLAFIILLCLIVVSCCEAKGLRGPAAPVGRKGRRADPTEKVFNILDFGPKLKPGGRAFIAEHFQLAWTTACNYTGKARIVIPKGTFMIAEQIFDGPCKGSAPVTIQIAGTLKADPDITNYQSFSELDGPYWMQFRRVTGLVITGGGTLDAQGSNELWEKGGEGTLPMSLKLLQVKNANIRKINFVNAMGFHIGIIECQNIRARNLQIFTPQESPNTDGIHISRSSQLSIANSVIGTGDDCIGIIDGTTDVKISNVTCGPGHGISIGSLGKTTKETDVRGVTVTNCTLRNTQNGVRIKTIGGEVAIQASGLLFQDIFMDNVTNPIFIDQNYKAKSKPSNVKLSDIRYVNIRGTSSSPIGVQLTCSNVKPCERVFLSDINMKYVGPAGKAEFSSSCANAGVSYAGVQFPPPCNGQS